MRIWQPKRQKKVCCTDNCIVLWILSLPLLFFPNYAWFSYFGHLATMVFGIIYLVQCRKPAGNVAFLSVTASLRRRKRIWLLWGLFFIVSSATISAVTFGSNNWYGWPMDISGPYQTANIAIRYYPSVAHNCRTHYRRQFCENTIEKWNGVLRWIKKISSSYVC